MAEPNPDDWALTHMRWFALSTWDNEGGASPFRTTSGSTAPSIHNAQTRALALPLLLIGFAAAVAPIHPVVR
jgi:hypothetical protein